VASLYQHFSCTCIYLQGFGITVPTFLVYMYLPARLWHHRTNISSVHVFTCKAVASLYPYSSCTCIYLQGCGITVSIFLMYMYLPARLWHHRIHIPRVHVFTCSSVASPYQHFSCTCIYLQGCSITVPTFLVYMYLPTRLWHHRMHIPHVHVFTYKAVASTYPYSSCTCIYLQGCGITVFIFLVYMYLPVRLCHHCINISRVYVFTYKAVASSYQHFSCT